MSGDNAVQNGLEERVRPGPCRVLDPSAWRELARAEGLALLALWADAAHAYALFWDGQAPLLAAVPVTNGAYPAFSPNHPAAAWFERSVHDLWGHRAEGGADGRPWLDHGRWGVHGPLAAHPIPASGAPEPPEFLSPAGAAAETAYQIGRGPVSGDPAGPQHARFHVDGENAVRLEMRLGYAHRGMLALMRGQPVRAAARFAARIAGDSTVAHALAFAQAAEAALASAPPPRAVALRGIMAELERVAHHLGALASLSEAAGARRVAGWLGREREGVLAACQAAFGHRLMMDGVIPGGVAVDLADPVRLGHAVDAIARQVPALRRSCGPGSALAARLAGLGLVSPALARCVAAGGAVGRASGRDFDARAALHLPPYADLTVPALRAGDAAARAAILVEEIAESARLLARLLAILPDGPLSAALPPASGEGIGVAEGPRGDCWHWLRIEGGIVISAFARDPGWAQLPLLEAAMEGALFEDADLIARSFGIAASGMDL